jgi:uncharacterized protein YfaP (DUF2135 family)
MKKILFTVLAGVMFAGVAQAASGDTKATVISGKIENVKSNVQGLKLVVDCYGVFYVHDSKGNFVAKHTIEKTTATSADCYELIGGQYKAYQAQYAADYKITFSISVN